MITSQQYEILSRYGAGMDIEAIAKHTGIDRDDVSQTVTKVATMNRQRAGHLTREYDTAKRNGRLTAVPARPVSAPPAAEQTIEQLLDAAELTDVPRIVKAAGKIRTLVGELHAAVREAEREQRLRDRIEKLRAELDKAQADLRGLSGKPAPARAARRTGDAPSARDIRAWAAANGVECNTHGIIPQRVRDAYAAAHTEGEAA